MTPTRRRTPPAEDGFVLIEILVSALILAIVAGAVLTLMQSSARSAADQRRHSTAIAIAQEDQARLRSTRISSLNRLSQITPMTIDGDQYTVESTGVFVNNSSGTDASCVSGKSSADYVRVTSKVTWNGLGTRPPVVIQSIVSPSNGSLDASHGTLAISAINANNLPLTGVTVSGKGDDGTTFSGTTDSTGCANFADLPADQYDVTTTTAGLVDKTGTSPPAAVTVGVSPSNTVPLLLYYDHPGSIPVEFKYREGSSGNFKASKMDSVMVYNAETGKTAKAYPSLSGARETKITATNLFPFSKPDTVYAGYCEKNNPNPNNESNPPGALALANVLVPSGGVAPTAILQLPALNLVVKKGSTLLVGATVKITETGCNVSRTFTTTTGGVLSDQGMPWGTYNICAQSGGVRKTVSGQKIQTLTSATAVTIDLNSGTSNGNCP